MSDTSTDIIEPGPDAPASGGRSPHPQLDDGPRSRFRTWAGRAAVAVALSSTLVWLGAIAYGTFGDYHLAGWLEDRRFPDAAEPICKAAMEDVNAFPPARTATSPEERAVVIRDSTARLTRMIDDLRAEVPDTADAKWINLWLDDWGIHIADRLDFADRLDQNGAKEEFFESLKADVQISKSLNHFAEVNRMESCTTPGDV